MTKARWIALAAALSLAAPVAAWLAWRSAIAWLEREIASALGPGSRVESVQADASGVEIRGLSLPGGDGWPAAESLRAERVHVAPSWRSLLAHDVRIARVEIEGLALSALRTRDGRVRLLPSLLERPAGDEAPRSAAPESGAATRGVRVDEIRVTNGVAELHDASVGRTPWKLRLAEIDATVRDVAAPALADRMPVQVSAVLDGPERDGRVALSGWVIPSSGDLELRAELVSADLLALRPYLIEATKARLAHGTLDLALEAAVRDRRLHAPGRLTLSDLAFAPGGSASARVLGVPRDLLLAGLRAKGGRIALDFVLDGRVDDPRFSLNEQVGTRVAVALAKELGVSVGGLARGTLGLGIEGVEGAGRAASGVGAALKRLLPGR
ncbi:MAG: hypothetical protein DCC71_03025 [Proteobacteria bacterium]|nr:MAG: hypothetical protein DCC71_03025 [Pseudomonadota bacterium]